MIQILRQTLLQTPHRYCHHYHYHEFKDQFHHYLNYHDLIGGWISQIMRQTLLRTRHHYFFVIIIITW